MIHTNMSKIGAYLSEIRSRNTHHKIKNSGAPHWMGFALAYTATKRVSKYSKWFLHVRRKVNLYYWRTYVHNIIFCLTMWIEGHFTDCPFYFQKWKFRETHFFIKDEEHIDFCTQCVIKTQRTWLLPLVSLLFFVISRILAKSTVFQRKF